MRILIEVAGIAAVWGHPGNFDYNTNATHM